MAALALALTLTMPPVAQAKARNDKPKQGKTIHHGHHDHSRHKRNRKQRPIYWGAWIGNQVTGTEAPWDMGAVSTLSGLLGKGLSLIQLSSPLTNCHQSPCSFYDFPTEQMEKIRSYGAIPFFSWSTASSAYDPATATDPDYRLRDISSGRYDQGIRRFAADAASWGHPFFLRFNWEMNGNWFPWAESTNGNAPGDYIAAWRHVHDIFASEGATNATWVWCPYVDINHKFQDLRSVYPGDAYVDWTCLDGFNWAQNSANPQRWRSFDRIFRSTYRFIIRQVAPKKPMLLAEIASNGPSRAKSIWIRKMFKQLRTNYRRIRGLIWFDKIDRGVNWPLETSVATIQAFAKGIRGAPFRVNQYGDLPPQVIQPPR